MSGSTIEEQAIHHAQHLDLIYSQAITLYKIITHALGLQMKLFNLNPNPMLMVWLALILPPLPHN